MSPKAVVLLSGGLDSATCLAFAINEGYDAMALTFRYGQRHAVEIECAKRIADRRGVKVHKVIDLDLRIFGGSALTDDIPVPKGRSLSEIQSDIPITYVPARNTIFLAYALAFAELAAASHIFIGVNALDYSGYPDCRPEFIAAFERLANLATKSAVEGCRIVIHTPLINMTKADIIRLGIRLGVDYSLTSSCYDPGSDGMPCGRCDACFLRLKGFREAGSTDPLTYPSGVV